MNERRQRMRTLIRPGSRWRATGGLVALLVVSAALLALGPAAGAQGAEATPELVLTGPSGETKDTEPTFVATAMNYTCEELAGNCGPVEVHILGVAAPLKTEDNPSGGKWSLSVSGPLAPATYTAFAEQTITSQTEPLKSNILRFTVQQGPQVSITFPASGSSSIGDSQTVAGTASTANGDRSEVTVNLYAGSAVGPSPPLALTVQRSATDGSWSAPFGGLSPGTYTVQAVQKASAGNSIGRSNAVTFTLSAPASPPPPPPPRASFTWFPPNPAAGQSVALVSSSTDPFSPIGAFAWDLAGNGPFKPGGPVLTTAFPTPGNHIVRLQVADARGAAGIATETIGVSPAPLTLMQPFPIVRIAGNQNGNGVLISLLTVDAPVGARVSVSCRGRGCSKRSISVAVASARNSKSSSALISFHRPEHRLHAGAVLEIRVSREGEIGKYTRFTIHRRRLPGREDACLSSLGPRPIACPA